VAIPRRNRRGVGQAISALKAGGLSEKSDESVCALARASAEVLDDALAFGDVKACALSNLMRTHLMICEALRSRRGPDDGDSAYAVPVVDKTGFVKRSPKVAGLRPVAPARAEIEARPRRGEPAGVPFGPLGPVRKVPTDRQGARHRAGFTGPSRCHPRSGRLLHPSPGGGRPCLPGRPYRRGRGARHPTCPCEGCQGHLAVLRQREDFVAGGGLELEVALNRYQDPAGQLREGKQEGNEIAAAADPSVERLRSAPSMAEIEQTHGPLAMTTLASWIVSRRVAGTGDEAVVDALTWKPIGVEAKPAGSRK